MAHRWTKPTKNKRRIDPRYFLEETAARGEEIEEASDPSSYDQIRAGGPWIDYGTGKEIDPEDHLGRPYENLVNDLSDLIMRSIEEDGMDPAEARRAVEEAMDIELGVNR